jgi:formylglycine-generating enzyme required for sulfatase activity
VNIARPFGIGVYEVSFEEFRAFCQSAKRSCPEQPWTDPKLPVVNVPWTLASEYVEWLSTMSGARYRLPSESEWEYAARGGTTTPYPFGDEALPTHARFSFRGVETTPVAANDRTVNRNKFRLYHTIGNVREWVLDVWQDNHESTPLDGSARQGNSNERVARGGSYGDSADRIRSASRTHLAAGSGDEKTGFRVLREID